MQVVQHNPSSFPPPLLPPVRSSHDCHRSPVHYLKGVRGYRAIARRRRRGRRKTRRRPAAPLVGRCTAWVQVPRSAARSARLSTRAAGPGDLLQRRFLRGGSSPKENTMISQSLTNIGMSCDIIYDISHVILDVKCKSQHPSVQATVTNLALH
jgi:hypothetical protein